MPINDTEPCRGPRSGPAIDDGSPAANLFDTEPPPWELDDAETNASRVVLATGPSGEFDYLVPATFADERKPEILAEAGRRVQVPLGRGNRPVIGYCIDVGMQPVGGRKLKSLAAVIDPRPLLSERMLTLGRWIADYYLAPIGQVLESILPAGVRGKAGTRETTLFSVPTKVAAKITRLDLPEKQAKVLSLLAASTKPLTMKQLMARAECTAAPVNALRKKELIASHVERIDTDPLLEQPVARKQPLELNDQQSAALTSICAALDSRKQSTILLHGVTGSGKTEVYIQAIEEVVRFGRQAIVLVPEISLTPQTRRAVSRALRPRGRAAQPPDRRRAALAMAADRRGRGAGGRRCPECRSSPRRRILGLIVHRRGARSRRSSRIRRPRYHARDVAFSRAADGEVPLVLGSATPSLESWHRAHRRRVPARRDAATAFRTGRCPAVRTVDLRAHDAWQASRGASAGSCTRRWTGRWATAAR